MKKIVLGGLIAASMLVLSGCSMTGKESLKVSSYEGSTKIMVVADKDNTALGPINVGNVMRENYKIALGKSAMVALDRGYKYFTVVYPPKFVKFLEQKKPKTVEDFYGICDDGEGSFRWAISYKDGVLLDKNPCDTIVFQIGEATLLRGTVKHAKVTLISELSNEKLKEYSLDAQEVLNSQLIKDIDPEMFQEE